MNLITCDHYGSLFKQLSRILVLSYPTDFHVTYYIKVLVDVCHLKQAEPTRPNSVR